MLGVNHLPVNAGGAGGLVSGGGHGNPFQYSCLQNPMQEEFGGLQSIGSQRVGHDCVTKCHGHSVSRLTSSRKSELTEKSTAGEESPQGRLLSPKLERE